ncbi:MAG TPA: hypothetical protein VI603_07500, partial [Saprospiraceae bacterium]|nr:hypothetical protein [Saprospiraceae bacterium]
MRSPLEGRRFFTLKKGLLTTLILPFGMVLAATITLYLNPQSLRSFNPFTKEGHAEDVQKRESGINDAVVSVVAKQDSRSLKVFPLTMGCPTIPDVECLADVPLAYADYTEFVVAGGTVTDTCSMGGLDDDSFTVTTDTVNLGTCQYEITRTYSIMDSCGNTEMCDQVIMVADATAPTWDQAPGALDTSFTCNADVVVPPVPTATDNCIGNTVTVNLMSDVTTPGVCVNDYIRILTYEAEDGCGNTSSQYTVTITVNDNIAPTWDQAPGALDTSFTCNAEVVVPPVPTATDNCTGNNVTVDLMSDVTTPGACVNDYVRILTYEAEDGCGNTSSQYTITITVADNVAPTWDQASGALDTSFTCNADVVVPPAPTATDNCTGNTVTVDLMSDVTTPGACVNDYVRVLTYEAEDGCGNTSSQYTITITVADNVAPTWDQAPGALDTSFICNADVVVPPAPTATDNCTGNTVTVNLMSDVTTPGACVNNYVRVLTYEAEDGCGNTSSQYTVTITVNDNVAPTADPLGDLGPFPCYANRPASNINVVTGETDNCGGAVEVTFINDSSNPGCSGTVTRTYRLTDDCGNTANIVQNILINDTVPPTANPMPDLGPYQCYANRPPANILFVTGEADNCGGAVRVTYVGDSANPGCSGTVLRTYLITDACGVTANVVQNILIDDTVPPTADLMPDLGPFACDADIPAPDIALVTGEIDNCGGAVSVSFINDSADPGCMGTVQRTYMLTDACGNTDVIIQNILINDDVSPTADSIPDLGPFACDTDLPAPDITLVTGEIDNCGGVVNVSFFNDSTDPGCMDTIQRTYILTDECGNTADIIQNILINDDVSPTADPMPDLGPFACYADRPAPDITAVTGEIDNCGGAVNVSFFSDSANPGCAGTVLRTYRLTDACGNMVDIFQNILINDNVAPTANPMPDLGPYQCYADRPAANIIFVTGEADNCGGAVTVSYIGDSANPGCQGTVVRTYRITDVCGITANVVQNILINDNTAPVFSTADPLDITVSCMTQVPPPGAPRFWFDNCGASGSSPAITISNESSCPRTLFRTWTATDPCGNMRIDTQRITVHDMTLPVLSAPPADTTVSCFSEVPLPFNLAWTDNCVAGGGTVLSMDVSDETSCPGLITRSWTTTDSCGNTATVSQLITVNDLVPPVFTSPPANITVECLADVPPAQSLTWTDNCDGTGSEPANEVEDGNICPRLITRTWTYTDACGNMVMHNQNITVDDNTPPVFVAPPVDLTVSCPDAVPSIIDLTWMDNCDGTGIVSGIESTDEMSCPEIITRIWTHTDVCGNVVTYEQSIVIHDLQPPVFDPPPGNTSVQCIDDVPAMTDLNWTDNCDGSGIVTGSDVTNGVSCPEIITRSWTYTDSCGNTTSVSQMITVDDDTPPVFDTPPPPVTIECAVDIPPMIILNWTDNCEGSGSVSGIDIPNGGSCPEIITRSWNYFDGCGNISTVIQSITVWDTTDPVFDIPAPPDTIVQCFDDIPLTAVLNYTDNCDPAGNVTGVDVSDGNTCPETITRTWTFTDSCGNMVQTEQTIMVWDDIDPIFTTAIPADTMVSCTADIPSSLMIDWSDNCDGAGFVANIDISDGLSCPETIIRTWTYEDGCAHIVTAQQTIVVHDQIAPDLSTAPADVTVDCDLAMTMLQWTDNCDGTGMINGVDMSDGGSCPEIITRTWTYTDGCDNSVADTQIITIHDLIPPVIVVCPSDTTVNCPSNVPAPNVNGVVWTDNCGIATVTHVSDDTVSGFSFDGASCPALLSRKYQVTDECGNFTICEQLITIRDRCDPLYVCPLCTGNVPFFFVDLSNNPDSMWVSDPVVRDGICCGETGPPPPRCIHFSLILPPDVIAITFDIESGAIPPGALYYQIDCDTLHPVGEPICLQGGTTYQLTFCKPGNNINTYSITAYSADILPDTIISQVDCSGNIEVTGITSTSAVWNDITGGGIYNSFLSCLSGCLTNVFTPDSTAPTVILYQVCGDAGTILCNVPVNICDTIVAYVYPKIEVTVNPNPAIFCVDDIGTLVSSVTPTGTYSTSWFSGPNGTGTEIATTPDYTPTAPGTYSIVVTDLVNTFFCNKDTLNINVTFVPLPQFELGSDTSICSSESITIDLPDGPTYTWIPNTGVSQGGDLSIFILSPTDTVNYSVTASTPEGCETTDLLTLNVVQCQIQCPSHFYCLASDIVPYGTVSDFENAGGFISLPCAVQNANISLLAISTDGLSCPETITHTYEITDDCGNAEVCDVIITINDTIPPVWDNAPAPIGPLSCFDPIPPHEILTGTDNCALIITTSVDPYTIDFCNGYSVTLRWSLTDSCGNSAPDQFIVVTFLPPALPVFVSTPVSDTTLICDALVGYVIPDLDYDNGETGSCQIIGSVAGVINGPIDECGGQHTIEWNYIDSCGRVISFTQTVTVSDEEDPVIDCPPDGNFECIADVPAPFTDITEFENAGGMISDNCGINASTFDFLESISVSGCQRIITRLYFIEDSCGNYAECDQIFNVEDISSPVISCPPILNTECSAQVPAIPGDLNEFTTTYGGSASDNCGIESFNVAEVISGVPCSLIIQRTFIVTDSCGFTASCDQIINLIDTIGPTIICPADVIVECIVDVPAPLSLANFISNGWISDNCGIIQSSFTVAEIENGTCPRIIERTYSVEDSCGNISSCIHTITVNDTTAPIMTCPPDASIACLGDLPVAYSTPFQFIVGGGSITDNCGLVGSTFGHTDSIASGQCPVVYRTYFIEDSCGNVGNCLRIYTVIDNTPPQINCPADMSVDCAAGIPPPDTSLVTATDNCGNVSITFVSDISDGMPCSETVIRTYQVMDVCGNTSECVQLITILPPSAPVFLNPPGDTTITCADAAVYVATTLSYTNNEIDSCEISGMVQPVVDEQWDECGGTITITWDTTVICSYPLIYVQTITIDIPDFTPPAPTSETVNCYADIVLPVPPIVFDACGTELLPSGPVESSVPLCEGDITYTWTYTDCAGSTHDYVHTVTIDIPDFTPPAPTSETVNCYADIVLPAPPIVFDACGTELIPGGPVESGVPLCEGDITYTWTYTDCAGSIHDYVHTVTIDIPDFTPPAPTSETVNCYADIVLPAPPTVFDACGTELIPGGPVEGSVPLCEGDITYTWTYTDCAGSTHDYVHTVTIDIPDFNPPAPTSETVNCYA